MELTRRYSKDQILEMYMNEISYGNRAYGIEAAAETYFGKPAKELTLAEASLLAGSAPGAVVLRPLHQPGRPPASARRTCSTRWCAPARSPRAERARRRAAPIKLVPAEPTAAPHEAPHFVTYVRQQVEAQFGTEALFREGLQITTSLDLDLQHLAEKPAADHIADISARNATNAALVPSSPTTGEVMAMLGSVDFDDPSIDGQVNVALAPRQPGSTLKPFTYVTAFGKGWNPATLLWDIPTTFPGGYRPNDFDDKFPGPMTVRDALAQSRNIPAVEALQFVSVPEMLATAHRLGHQRPARSGPLRPVRDARRRRSQAARPDLCLCRVRQRRPAGRAPTCPPTARGQGFRQFDPVSILKVTDATRQSAVRVHSPKSAEVADPRLVYQITSILSDDGRAPPTYGAQQPAGACPTDRQRSRRARPTSSATRGSSATRPTWSPACGSATPTTRR